MSHEQRKAEDIAHGNWEAILGNVGLTAYLSYKVGPCPVCSGDKCFRWKSKDRGESYAETGYCFRECGFLSPFALLQHAISTDFRGACDHIRKWAGDTNLEQMPQRRHVALPTPEEDARKLDNLRYYYKKLWDEGFRIETGMEALEYLKSRAPGLKEIPKVLRAHPGLAYKNEVSEGVFELVGHFPAMLAVAQGLDGSAVNIWRTYLDKVDPRKKAPFDDAKKAAGRFLQQSWAVRLFEPDDELGVAEGIETALNATLLYGIPTWSTLNAVGMEKFDLPAGYERVKKIRIFGDNDSSKRGNTAAAVLKEKMRAKGLTASIILPRFTNFDFADIGQRLAA